MRVWLNVFAILGHLLTPTYFWIAGILRKQQADMKLAVALLLFFTALRFASPVSPAIEVVHDAGIIAIGMATTLLVMGVVRRTAKAWKLVTASLCMAALGFLMLAVCD